MNENANKIALYDIDYTIISCNSLSAFTFYIIKKNPLKIFILFLLFVFFVLWSFRAISTKRIKSLYLLMLKGMDKSGLEKLSSDFVKDKLIPKLKPEAVKSIEEYKNRGYLIILATASFEIYMKYLAEYLKADYYFGTKIFFRNNMLEPEIEGKNCRGKEKIRRILAKLPENKITKKGSVSFSDELTDLPFLELTEVFHKISMRKWKILGTYKSDI